MITRISQKDEDIIEWLTLNVKRGIMAIIQLWRIEVQIRIAIRDSVDSCAEQQ